MDEELNKAKKFLNIMNEFEISSGNMEKNINIVETEIIKDLKPIHYQEEAIIESIIDTKNLIEDFTLIRTNLKTNIETVTIMLTKLGNEISTSEAEDINPEILKGYSELIKSSNNSMKLLIDSYERVAKVQSEVKKFIKNIEDENNEGSTINTTNTTNNVFIGSSKDLLKSLTSH